MAEDTGSQDIVSHVVEQTADAVSTYWTRERIDSAEPLPLPTVDRLPPVPDAAAGGLPVARHAVPAETEDSGGSCYTTTEVSDLSDSPYQYVGKLYMTFGDKNYVGSAWCIDTHSVFTAGHCLYHHADDNNPYEGWATNVQFKGRYDDGSDVGDWSLSHLAVPKGWTNDEGHQYDMGAAISSSNIQKKTGSAGWLANASPDQGTIDAVGYPAEEISGYDFDGQSMWHSEGSLLSGNTTVMQMCNNMTGGCSGGPWSVDHDGNNRMYGINSFRYTADPSSMYSPYFGSIFLNLVDWIDDNDDG